LADKELPDSVVAAFLTGDPAVHAELRRAVRAVVRCFHFNGSTTEEDLVQEALYRVFLNLRSGAFRGESSLRTFTQKVAEYTCLEHMRRKRFRIEVDPGVVPDTRPDAEPESLLLRAEEHRRNLRRLAALSSECRELFHMIFIERLSYAEIARKCGISETAVKLRVHRCRLTAREAAPPAGVVGPRPRRKEAGE
jgi:RNA polymerase sigma-70 factor (ECF subfamily)